MNAVEIEEAVSRLAEAPFDPESFPLAFLEAFGNKQTTLKRLKSNSSNQSDLGGVLQRNNIHLKVCSEGEVTTTLTALRESPATVRYKAKFILATDGQSFEAENLADGETIACNYPDFHDHFGFFLALAGITTVRQIRENAFDIKATARLNRLYIELLKDNPDWDKTDRREDLNHFMARLIFCFFAEDTNIFHSSGIFTSTIAQMSDRDSSNTHEVLSELFRSMSMPLKGRESAQIRNWANNFPYVNGGLFSAREDGGVEVPRFSKIARSYLLHVGNLDWTKINPDIFGSMIQAVADDEERGALGMHYTSVPNILKVLNPLFLDDLRAQLEAAGDNARKLLNLRQRMARIRVFDPACGSGNFLVIAYKEMRAIEAKINEMRGEGDRHSDIPLTNFRGIELRHFSCEIARLALIIAEYQCDVLYRGPKLALLEFLPLKADNWITCGNALRLDWLSLCPPTGTGVRVQREDLDLWGETREQAEIEFENEGGETYICGNPPYIGSQWRTETQQEDMKRIFSPHTKTYKDLDYVTCWFILASQFLSFTDGRAAFVATKSICQGIQVAMLWPLLLQADLSILFAHRPFHWSNLAKANAGVTCVIVGLGKPETRERRLFDGDQEINTKNIGPYLIPMPNIIVWKSSTPLNGLPTMDYGNKPSDGGHLVLSKSEATELTESYPKASKFLRLYVGAQEFTCSTHRYCLWMNDENLDEAQEILPIRDRLKAVKSVRQKSKGLQSKSNAETPHRFVYAPHQDGLALIVPSITSSNREYLPCGLTDSRTIASNKCAVVYDAKIWLLAVVASSLHLQWIANVCVRMRNDFSYSNTLGWNTFPVPTLTDRNKADLTRCAEDILLAREQYFPATIADMYDRDRMDTEFPLVREAHDRNDEAIERIYIGRRFKNDTERLEKLFEFYTKMTTPQALPKKSAKGKIHP
jgi:hypothetical protein